MFLTIPQIIVGYFIQRYTKWAFKKIFFVTLAFSVVTLGFFYFRYYPKIKPVLSATGLIQSGSKSI